MTDKTRDQLIAELSAAQQEVAQLLLGVAAVQDWQREPVEWSFRYIAAHLAAAERECHRPRIVRIATGERPHFNAYTESGVDFAYIDLTASLAVWADERRDLLDFVATLPDEALTYTGVYPIIGEVTLLDALDDLLAQDQAHARHVRQLIEDYIEDCHS